MINLFFCDTCKVIMNINEMPRYVGFYWFLLVSIGPIGRIVLLLVLLVLIWFLLVQLVSIEHWSY